MKLLPHMFYSSALRSRKTCYVLLPDQYDATNDTYPVIYLLHGRSGCETDWLYKGHAQQTIELAVEQKALRDCIVVIPSDGGHETGTFYVDWYDGSGNFEQYFIYDLIPSIDEHFRTMATKQGRAIAGLSMGGYGSFVLSLRNPHLFGTAASLSGALGDMSNYPAPESARIIGPVRGAYAEEHDLYELTKLRKEDPFRPYLYLDCGTEDFLYEHNKAMHQHLLKLEYPHVYREFSGAHTWEYWTEHLRDVLEFIEECFAKTLKA